jgi:hypothetical protein
VGNEGRIASITSELQAEFMGEQFAVFATALGLMLPWEVTQTALSVEQKRFDIRVDVA